MIDNVNMLGSRPKFWKPSQLQLQLSLILLKYLALYIWFSTQNWKAVVLHLLYQIHNRKDITLSHRHGNVFGFSGGQAVQLATAAWMPK